MRNTEKLINEKYESISSVERLSSPIYVENKKASKKQTWVEKNEWLKSSEKNQDETLDKRLFDLHLFRDVLELFF